MTQLTAWAAHCHCPSAHSRQWQVLDCFRPRLARLTISKAPRANTIQVWVPHPMSEVAGRMAIQVGANFLEKTHGGRGVLLGGVPGMSDQEPVAPPCSEHMTWDGLIV